MVVGSIATTGFVLDAGGQLQKVAMVANPVSAGMALTAEDVVYIAVPADPMFAGLLTQDEVLSRSRLVAGRSLVEGSLLISQDLVEPTTRDDSVITLSLAIGNPPWMRPGNPAQLWVAAPLSESAFSSPFILSSEVVIDRVSTDDGFAADSRVSLVDVRVPVRDVPGAIHALANNYLVYLTPVAPVP